MRTFLDRRASLRDGTDPARESTRERDKAAVQLLAARRIVDDAEEQRLRKLIAEATSLADMPVLGKTCRLAFPQSVEAGATVNATRD